MKTGTAIMSALALLAAVPAAAQQADTAKMATGRTYAQWFYQGRTDTLWALLAPNMRAIVPSAAQLAAVRESGLGRTVTELQVVGENVGQREGGETVYRRVSRVSTATVAFQMTIGTTPDGKITTLGIRPWAADSQSRAGYTTRTPLRLPFDGEWYVGWGGRTREQNYHVVAVDQRYAYDLLVLRDGKSHTGDGTRLEQYHCWGRPILAPGAGTVVTALDSLADQAPGTRDRANPLGNHVEIDHGNGEFSLLAHLRRGSVAVRAGQRVAAGDKLGECGNSGNTSEPHLHYHLQNGPGFGRAEGLPAQFIGYTANGQRVERGEPVRGQTIRP